MSEVPDFNPAHVYPVVGGADAAATRRLAGRPIGLRRGRLGLRAAPDRLPRPVGRRVRGAAFGGLRAGPVRCAGAHHAGHAPGGAGLGGPGLRAGVHGQPGAVRSLLRPAGARRAVADRGLRPRTGVRGGLECAAGDLPRVAAGTLGDQAAVPAARGDLATRLGGPSRCCCRICCRSGAAAGSRRPASPGSARTRPRPARRTPRWWWSCTSSGGWTANRT